MNSSTAKIVRTENSNSAQSAIKDSYADQVLLLTRNELESGLYWRLKYWSSGSVFLPEAWSINLQINRKSETSILEYAPNELYFNKEKIFLNGYMENTEFHTFFFSGRARVICNK